MTFLTGRTIRPEHMDDPAASAAALGESLRFIRAVNRRLGGIGAALRPLRRWSALGPRGRPIRILDVGTGSADIPLAIARWADGAGHRVHVVAVDNHPTTLALARAHVGPRDDIELVQADALSLAGRFEPRSFDWAHAGMFLHHLTDVQVMTVLRAMERLTRGGIIWNDLLRGAVGRVGVRLLTLAAPAMVAHDGRVSVEAGFTKAEALDLAARAGLGNVAFRRHLGYRFTLVSEKAG